MQPCPGLLVHLPRGFAEALARVLQGHDEQVGTAILARAIERESAQAEVDLCFLSGQELQDVEPHGIARLQAGNEALDRVVTMRELPCLDQVLKDALRVAPQLDLLLDPGTMRLAGRRSRECSRDRTHDGSRWPGWGIFHDDRLGAGGHPGGFCPAGVPPDRLAVDARPPRDLPMADPATDQCLNGYPQVALQDVHSSPPSLGGEGSG